MIYRVGPLWFADWACAEVDKPELQDMKSCGETIPKFCIASKSSPALCLISPSLNICCAPSAYLIAFSHLILFRNSHFADSECSFPGVCFQAWRAGHEKYIKDNLGDNAKAAEELLIALWVIRVVNIRQLKLVLGTMITSKIFGELKLPSNL